jgi:hypothetical protein
MGRSPIRVLKCDGGEVLPSAFLLTLESAYSILPDVRHTKSEVVTTVLCAIRYVRYL